MALLNIQSELPEVLFKGQTIRSAPAIELLVKQAAEQYVMWYM